MLKPGSFGAHITSEQVNAATRSAFSELDTLVERGVQPPAASGQICDPEKASAYFHTARQLVESFLLQEASGYSRLRWVWYLRQLPRTIYGDAFTSTAQTCIRIAEVAAALGGAENPEVIAVPLVFKADEAALRRVLRFCGMAKYLSNIHSFIRGVSKGAEFTVTPRGLLQAVPRKEQMEAIFLYDQRAEESHFSLNRLGTFASPETLEAGKLDYITVTSFFRTPGMKPVRVVEQDGVRSRNLYCNYGMKTIGLGELKRLANDRRLVGREWWRPGLPGVLSFLRCLPRVVVNDERILAQIYNYGMFVASAEDLEPLIHADIHNDCETLRDTIPGMTFPESMDQMLKELAVPSVSLWPLTAGPCVQKAENTIVLDPHMASCQIELLVESQYSTGEAANPRGEHFEEVVQRVINSSPWKPDEALLGICGRTIRRDRVAISDIDAIGAKGRTLLVVSCKSRVNSEAYNAGDYRTIRNVASGILEAVNQAESLRQDIQGNPRGDNFDFSTFEQVIVVVCTPLVVYVPMGSATRYLTSGLRACVPLRELQRWLADS